MDEPQHFNRATITYAYNQTKYLGELRLYVRYRRKARCRALMMRARVEGRLTVEQTDVVVMTGFPESRQSGYRRVV